MSVTHHIRTFRSTLEDLGHPAAASHGWEGPLDRMPAALVALYRVAARHPLNHVHHRLLLPDELERHGSHVVFAIENQETVVWAYDGNDGATDPSIWQGHPTPGHHRAIEDWYPEHMTLTEFMPSMWRWLTDPDGAG